MDFEGLQCLERLCNLESITCVFGGKGGHIWGQAVPEERLAKVFESFKVKPKVEVIMGGKLYHGNVDRWPAHF
jgi:hypothetical protein